MSLLEARLENETEEKTETPERKTVRISVAIFVQV